MLPNRNRKVVSIITAEKISFWYQLYLNLNGTYSQWVLGPDWRS